MLPRRRRTIPATSDYQDTPSFASGSSSTTLTTFEDPNSTQIKPASPSKILLLEPTMSSRDRTPEFISTVKSMQERMNNGYMVTTSPAPSHKRAQLKQEWSQFSRLAKKIGADISNTFVKLEKLTLLAKRRTLFDDRPLEIQELTHIIKEDINNLNREIAHLQEIAKARKQQYGARHIQSHSNSVVVSLQSKLASMSNDFKQVLQVRTENLKHQKNRREQFTQGSVVPSSLPPSAFSGHHNGPVLLADQSSSDQTTIDLSGGETASLLRQDQLSLIDEQDAYIQDRADTMQNIESTIVELGSIFQQLAHMVKEQDEMVQRIDANIEDTSLNVEAAHSEISRYFQSVTSNRWLMIKVFGVLIVFFIIFIVISGS